MKHYLTEYEEKGKKYVESWLQINILGKSYCFWRKRIEISSKKIGEDEKIGLDNPNLVKLLKSKRPEKNGDYCNKDKNTRRESNGKI